MNDTERLLVNFFAGSSRVASKAADDDDASSDDDDVVFVGDMTPAEFVALLQEAFAPLIAQAQALAESIAIQESPRVGAPATKERLTHTYKHGRTIGAVTFKG